jgi:hypothetical protein
VAFSAAGRKTVSVGISLSALPSAPGAPSGQSGMTWLVCAFASEVRSNNGVKVIKNFMV